MNSGVCEPEDWQNLRVVETIYEEDSGEDSCTTPSSVSSPPPPSSPSAASLRSRVKLWSLNNEVETNVIIHVQGSSFRLHKDPLAQCSRYLKRQLTESSDVTISPPLKITPHTFTLVANHCYGGHLFITPFNVASLLLAADLLEMNDEANVVENLGQKTEAYFCRTVAVDRDYAGVVLKSCMGLLPEVETRTGVVSRCIEVMKLNCDAGAGDVLSWFDGVQEISGEEFRLLVDALHRRLNGTHDLLYRIIDFYFKAEGGKMTEEQGSKICNYIDCSNLSSQMLMHAVQNHRMPLRFVVQAMFVEQLNTRRSVFSAAQTLNKTHNHRQIKPPAVANASVTLGAILQRDAALRQVAHLRDTMDFTSSRIQSLEDEIHGLKKILTKTDAGGQVTDRVKSESFRFSSERMVERGQRGSVSSGSLRTVDVGNGSDHSGDQASPRGFGKRVMSGLKSAFRKSGLGRSRGEVKSERLTD